MSPNPSNQEAKLQYQEQFNEWMSHPTTRKLFQLLESKIQDRKDAWASGELLASFAHEQFIKEAVAKGFISACYEILSIEAKDLEDNE